MIKTILLVLVLFSSAFIYAQHDMKNMPGMKMPSHPSSEKSAAKDTIPAAMHDMQMQKESDTTHSSLQQSFEKVNLSPGKTVRYDLYGAAAGGAVLSHGPRTSGCNRGLRSFRSEISSVDSDSLGLLRAGRNGHCRHVAYLLGRLMEGKGRTNAR